MDDPDVRDHLRRAAEGFQPDGRAFEGTMRRVRRRGLRRRVSAGALALVVSGLTVTAAVRALTPQAEDVAAPVADTPSPTTSAEDPSIPSTWSSCVNRALGYRIAFPGHWYTSNVGTWPDGRRERVPQAACHFFDPAPYSIVLSKARDPQDADGIDHRADRMVAFHVTLSSEGFAEGVERMRNGTRWTILGERSTEVDGRPAVVLAYEDRQAWDIYVVDLGDRGTLWFSIAKRSTIDPTIAVTFDRWTRIGARMLETFQLEG